jgi:hypothetical protein
MGIPYKYLALTVTVRFGPTETHRKLLKPLGNKQSSWGDRQFERIKFAAALASRGAPWRPGAAIASRGAGDALRGAGTLCGSREQSQHRNNDWLQSPVHSGGPSSLISRPNRVPKAAMDSSSYGAHACMLCARFGVRTVEDGHLTLLRAHGCMACQV